jgi:cytochrome c biogenesis protein CcmG/thiol:disulfide interchange protein DsbE
VNHRRRHALATIPRLGALVALAVASACGGTTTSPSTAAKVAFTAADGTHTSLADLKGTPTVVNLWATWCSPCVKEMPAFDRVATSTVGVRIIGVNVGDTAESATTFAAKLGVRYAQYTDPEGKLSAALSVSGLPATAFVDATGTVLQIHQGALTEQELRDQLAARFHLPAASVSSTP